MRKDERDILKMIAKGVLILMLVFIGACIAAKRLTTLPEDGYVPSSAP